MSDYPPTRISVAQIDALLPQTQCGRCDEPGCLPYARAVAAGAAHNHCPPGGQATADALARLLDRPALPVDRGDTADADTRTVAYIREDECIGCTKCIQACPVDAIVGAAKRMHTVIADECTGCDLCVAPCPVDCIDMLPVPETPYTWLGPDGGPGPDTAANREARVRADRARRRFRDREARLQREREEKDARRRARVTDNRSRPGDASPETAAADRQKEMRRLKTAYNMAHKQYKQARDALQRAERDGAAGLAAMRDKVDALEQRAEATRQRLNALMDEGKAALAAATGKDLKTLKLEAARAEGALVDQRRKRDRGSRDGVDAATLDALEADLNERRRTAEEARRALHEALRDQGLTD